MVISTVGDSSRRIVGKSRVAKIVLVDVGTVIVAPIVAADIGAAYDILPQALRAVPVVLPEVVCVYRVSKDVVVDRVVVRRYVDRSDWARDVYA